MLQTLKKKKTASAIKPAPASEAIVCGACNHVRKETDRNPEWQCPGCGKAYAKVGPIPEAEQQRRREASRQNQKKSAERHKSELLRNDVFTGLLIGASTFYSGLARTVASCAQPAVKTLVPANPLMQFVGAAIVVGTLIYMGYQIFR